MANRVAVIMSLYNNAELCRRAFWGFAAQDCADFEIILADDGSKDSEIDLVARAAQEVGLTVSHLWQPDQGFRKTRILNDAIMFTDADRLIFVDADMIPRRDFIANHKKLLRPGYSIAGGSHLNLPIAVQAALSRETVETGKVFEWDWLRQYSLDHKRFRLRLGKMGGRARLLDAIFRRSNAFIGCNSSCWREDALRVNGFDEDWGYGGEDREFGARLTNAGIRSRRHQFSLVALHQEHARSYRDPEEVKANKQKLKERIASGMTRVIKGIDARSQQERAKLLYQTAL